eukprot:88712-Rhodomonas_salina.1
MDSDSGTANSSEGVSVKRPTAEDVASYQETDLDEACGSMLLPCVATVGGCISEHLKNDDAQHPRACQCFLDGSIPA